MGYMREKEVPKDDLKNVACVIVSDMVDLEIC